MPVFTLMIMNVVAVMYLCVTDVVAEMLVTYSCCPAHGACKRLELFLVFVTAVWGVESALPLDTCSHLERKYSGVIFFSDCDSAFSK